MHYYYEAFHEFDKHQEGYISATVLGDLFRALGENPTSLELEVKRVNTQSSIPPPYSIYNWKKIIQKSEVHNLRYQKVNNVNITQNIEPGPVNSHQDPLRGQKIQSFMK